MKLVSVDQIVKSTGPVNFSKDVTTIYTETGDPVIGFDFSMECDSDDSVLADLQSNQQALKNALKPAVDTIDDLTPWPGSQNNDTRFVLAENCYYFMYATIWGTTPFTLDSLALMTEFIYKQSSVSIQTKFSTLMTDPASDECLIGNARDSWRETTPKLFFSKFHPADHSGKDFDREISVNHTDSNSLFYNSPNGLFNKQFKAFCDFRMASKPVKIIKQMTLLEINELDFSKKHSIDGNNYLLSEVQVTITNLGIKPATINAFTCF